MARSMKAVLRHEKQDVRIVNVSEPEKKTHCVKIIITPYHALL